MDGVNGKTLVILQRSARNAQFPFCRQQKLCGQLALDISNYWHYCHRLHKRSVHGSGSIQYWEYCVQRSNVRLHDRLVKLAVHRLLVCNNNNASSLSIDIFWLLWNWHIFSVSLDNEIYTDRQDKKTHRKKRSIHILETDGFKIRSREHGDVFYSQHEPMWICRHLKKWWKPVVWNLEKCFIRRNVRNASETVARRVSNRFESVHTTIANSIIISIWWSVLEHCVSWTVHIVGTAAQ